MYLSSKKRVDHFSDAVFLHVPRSMKENELKSKKKWLGSPEAQFQYLEVDGVNQHQNGELIDGSVGNDVGDAAFCLVGHPVIDDLSGLLCMGLRGTESKPAHPVLHRLLSLAAFYFLHYPPAFQLLN